MTSTSLPFGQWLRERRRALDLTQGELGKLAGCTGETIRKIEAGKRRPSRQLVEGLAVALGIPSDELPAFMWAARKGARSPCIEQPGTGAQTRPPHATTEDQE